jgi:hypothetical protein
MITSSIVINHPKEQVSLANPVQGNKCGSESQSICNPICIYSAVHKHLIAKTAQPIIALSGFNDDDERYVLKSIAQSLPKISVISDKEPFGYRVNFTHLIINPMSKITLKLLFAMSRGSWVLRPEWLYTLLDSTTIGQEDKFEMAPFEKTSRMMDVFENVKAYVVGDLCDVLPEDIEELLVLNGARSTRCFDDCNLCITDTVAPLNERQLCTQTIPCYDSVGKEETLKDLKMSYAEGSKQDLNFEAKQCVTPLWVIRSIVQKQKLPFNDFKPLKNGNVEAKI